MTIARPSLLAITIAACGSGRAPQAPSNTPTPGTPVRLAVARGRELSIVEVSPAGAKVVRAATVPARIDTLAWVGADPVALLQRGPTGICLLPEDFYSSHADYANAQRDCTTDPKLDGIVGRLTATGFVPYPALPETTWEPIAKPPKDATPCTSSCWSLTVTPHAVWAGHCKWVFSADGRDLCDTWLYARLDAPGVAQTEWPKEHDDTPAPELPTIAPSPRVQVSFASVSSPPRDEDDEPEAKPQLQCALDGKPVTSYPEIKDLDAGMRRDITWLANVPPMFAAYHNHDGFQMTEELVVFEGCMKSGVTELVIGPDGLVAFLGADLEIRRRGVLVGTSPRTGDLVVFAPN